MGPHGCCRVTIGPFPAMLSRSRARSLAGWSRGVLVIFIAYCMTYAFARL